VQTAIPDPGAPFSQMIAWRQIQPRWQFVDMGYALTVYRGPNRVPSIPMFQYDGEPSSATDRWGVGLSSVALIFATETLLRMRMVTVMEDRASNNTYGHAFWEPLITSAQFGMRNYAQVAPCVWLLRVLIWGVSVLFIALPFETVRSWVAPILLNWGGYRAYLIGTMTSLAGVTFITLLSGDEHTGPVRGWRCSAWFGEALRFGGGRGRDGGVLHPSLFGEWLGFSLQPKYGISSASSFNPTPDNCRATALCINLTSV
jgi:hypothetical protein